MIQPPRPLQVLIVDDSAVVRQVLRELISSDPGMIAVVAADPSIAQSKIQRSRPDVIVLDLELPVMDGLTWLRQLMATDPIPVIVCSACVGDAAIPAIRALEEGALEVVTKPLVGVRDFLIESRDSLLRAIRAAAGARLPSRRAPARPGARGARVAPGCAADLRSVVVIGASTGGPQALQSLLSQLTPECPGIVVAQHMPGAFTGAFARRLDELSELQVSEAHDGDVVSRGRVLIAPGGRHVKLRLRRPELDFCIELDDGPMVGGHRPSVDVLFRAAARLAGARVCGILLTGMGSDGAAGLLELSHAGATTWAESEQSCVVFGMPKVALESGAAQAAVSLAELPARLMAWAAADSDGKPRTTGHGGSRARPAKS